MPRPARGFGSTNIRFSSATPPSPRRPGPPCRAHSRRRGRRNGDAWPLEFLDAEQVAALGRIEAEGELVALAHELEHFGLAGQLDGDGDDRHVTARLVRQAG